MPLDIETTPRTDSGGADIRHRADVLVADGDWVMARGLQKTLEIAGYRVTATDALAACDTCHPDLALIAVELGDGWTGIDLARQCRARWGVPTVYVTAHADADTLSRAAKTRPAGYIVKPFQKTQLLSVVALALHQVRPSPVPEVAVPNGVPHTAPNAVDDRDEIALTPRELEVVRRLLANGRVRSIAEQLQISPHTVRNHLRSIFRKLGVHSQVELIRVCTVEGAA